MWLSGFLGVICLDVDIGLYVGLVYSLLVLIYRSSRPSSYLLGSINKTDVYVPLKNYGSAEEMDKIKIYQFCGPLHFSSIEYFRKDIIKKTQVSVSAIISERKKLNKKTSEKQSNARKVDNGKADDLNSSSRTSVNKITLEAGLPTHIIIDCSMFAYIDTSGMSMLKKTVQQYESIGITTYLANCASHVLQMLERDNFFVDVPPHHVYISVHDAVLHAIDDQKGSGHRAASSVTTDNSAVEPSLEVIEEDDRPQSSTDGSVYSNGNLSFPRNRF